MYRPTLSCAFRREVLLTNGALRAQLLRATAAAFALLLAGCASVTPSAGASSVTPTQASADWPTVGHDAGGTRFSPLAQITPANVASLQPAWVYHMKPADSAASAPTSAEREQAQAEQAGPPSGGAQGQFRSRGGGRFSASESIPLVVGETMYLATPYSRVVALDAASGRELWVHELPKGVNPSTRGLEYWPGDESSPPALIFGTSDGNLHSIRASDGGNSAGFGINGEIDLRTPDVMVGGPNKPYSLTSPPVVYRNLVITGAAVGEAIGGSRGDVRAWDAATGKLVWTFKSVPDAGTFGADSWGGDSGHNRSGVNVWGLMTVDPQRGILYLPFGAPASDRIGVDRPGNNLFSSSVVAVDASTGKYLWHFQVVHHDIWDNDAETPPVLMDVRHGGETIPAVAVISKNGMLFILNRVTGKPIYPVEERPVAASDVPGEQASPTQPFPVRPEPLARMSFSPDQVSTITPEHEAFCKALIADNNLAYGGPYNPPPYNRPGVYFPGTLGGVNWNGGSYDPQQRLFVVNIFALGQIMQIVPDGKGFFSNRGPLNGRFWDPDTRMPCQAGPWGEMVAVDVDTGEIAWRTPNGVSDNLPAAFRNTGRPSIGGPITTAGGLAFSAGTDDSRIRAFELGTGKEVWTYKLPASAHTNPITYGVGGRQFVAIVSTGGSFLGSPVTSDELTVFALPEEQK